MSSPKSARTAAAYSARLRRWNDRWPGFGFASAAGLFGALGRHQPGAELPHHLLAHLRVLGHLRDVEAGKRHVALLRLVVVALDAVLVNDAVVVDGKLELPVRLRVKLRRDRRLHHPDA
jgi:hypothetical protein